jgi:hypothetical protein
LCGRRGTDARRIVRTLLIQSEKRGFEFFVNLLSNREFATSVVGEN